MLGATCPPIPRAPLHSTFESAADTAAKCASFFAAMAELKACENKPMAQAELENKINSCVDSSRRSIMHDRVGIALGVAGAGLVAWFVFRK